MAKKKETKKYPETVKITFNPQFSAATRKTLLLREEETELVGNKVRKTYKPLPIQCHVMIKCKVTVYELIDLAQQKTIDVSETSLTLD